MKIFVSWSGAKSKACAEALRMWIKGCIQATKPWISSHDIDKGSAWSQSLSQELGETNFGIICCTAGNLTHPWLLFEAGAISKLPQAKACTFLIDIGPEALSGPLAQFQATKATKDDVYKLLLTINASLSEPLPEGTLTESFELWWPKLVEKLRSLPQEEAPLAKRSSDDVLVEILEAVRAMRRELVTANTSPYISDPTKLEVRYLDAQNAIRLAKIRSFGVEIAAKNDASFSVSQIGDELNLFLVDGIILGNAIAESFPIAIDDFKARLAIEAMVRRLVLQRENSKSKPKGVKP